MHEVLMCRMFKEKEELSGNTFTLKPLELLRVILHF